MNLAKDMTLAEIGNRMAHDYAADRFWFIEEVDMVEFRFEDLVVRCKPDSIPAVINKFRRAA